MSSIQVVGMETLGRLTVILGNILPQMIRGRDHCPSYQYRNNHKFPQILPPIRLSYFMKIQMVKYQHCYNA